MGTFVAVGNSCDSFSRLLDEVARLAADGRLPQPVRVQHGHTVFNSHHCKATPFLTREEFDQHLHKADVVIIHGGAGTLLQALAAHKVPVVVPRRKQHREIIDDHQLELVRTAAITDAAVVVEDVKELEAAVHLARERQQQAFLPREKRGPNLVAYVGQVLQSWENEVGSAR